MPEDDLTPEDDQSQEQSEDIKRLRKKAKDHDAAVERAELAERKLAVSEAGLKLSSRQLDALVATHKGDWTPDALTETAVDLGWAQAPEPPADTEEAQTHQRVEQASAGATADPGIDWDAKLDEAKTEAEFYKTYAESGRPMSGR